MRSPVVRRRYIGSRLHATVAGLVVGLWRGGCVGRAGSAIVALSGGVFQNRLLTDLCQDALEADGFRVLTQALVPANDGGLSLGQARDRGIQSTRTTGRPMCLAIPSAGQRPSPTAWPTSSSRPQTEDEPPSRCPTPGSATTCWCTPAAPSPSSTRSRREERLAMFAELTADDGVRRRR